jgi:hypothetical protein
MQDTGFRIQDAGFRIQDAGFRIQGTYLNSAGKPPNGQTG